MRMLHLPLPQLRALARACPGLYEAVAAVVERGIDPALRVLRISPEVGPPRWYIATGDLVLVLDATNADAMAAALPIFFVDLAADVRTELKPLFDGGAMQAELDKLIPFGVRWRNGGRPS